MRPYARMRSLSSNALAKLLSVYKTIAICLSPIACFIVSNFSHYYEQSLCIFLFSIIPANIPIIRFNKYDHKIMGSGHIRFSFFESCRLVYLLNTGLNMFQGPTNGNSYHNKKVISQWRAISTNLKPTIFRNLYENTGSAKY